MDKVHRRLAFAGQMKGHTLIELLVVVVILGILAAINLSAINNAKRKANEALCKSYNKQLEIYYLADPYRDGTSFTQRDFMQMFKISEKCWECHASRP